jgi:hypothetical protein
LATAAAAAEYGVRRLCAAAAPAVAAAGRDSVRQRQWWRRRRRGWCHVETENEILTGEIKIYVKDMSGHKFAQRGVVQICVFMTDIHIIGLKIGLKRHKFVFL